jgi:hypothetical protein
MLALTLAIGSFGALAPANALTQPLKTSISQAQPQSYPVVGPRLAASPCWDVSSTQAWKCIDTYGNPIEASIVRLHSGRYGVLLHSRGVTTDGKWNGQRVVVYHGKPLCKVSC